MDFGQLIAIVLTAMLVQNIILTQFLGICPFIGVSTKSSSAIGMGFSVLFVIVLSTVVTWTIDKYILVEFGLEYMRTIVFILVISSVVQFVEMFMKKITPPLYKLLGIYLPLITTNCAVLGVALLAVETDIYQSSFSNMLAYAVGISLGFTLVIYIFSTIRIRIADHESALPKSLQGAPVALITAAIMAMAFQGLAGVLSVG